MLGRLFTFCLLTTQRIYGTYLLIAYCVTKLNAISKLVITYIVMLNRAMYLRIWVLVWLPLSYVFIAKLVKYHHHSWLGWWKYVMCICRYIVRRKGEQRRQHILIFRKWQLTQGYQRHEFMCPCPRRQCDCDCDTVLESPRQNLNRVYVSCWVLPIFVRYNHLFCFLVITDLWNEMRWDELEFHARAI